MTTMVMSRPGHGDRTAAVRDGLAVIAIAGLWFVVQLMFLGSLGEHRAQETGYADLRANLAAATAPTGGVIEPGTPVALLSIPRLGLQQVVREGTASGDLLSGPGHRRDTPLPGQLGVSLVYGRAATYGAPFGTIATLSPGDQIRVVTQQGDRLFVVDDVRRPGDPLPPALPVDGARLTLVSAAGTGPLPALSPSGVVYVDATLHGKPFVPKAGRPTAVPKSEQTMSSDRSALPLLTLCLAALVALAAGAVWAGSRWSASLVWVITAPVVIALAWVSTDVATRMLPNLM